MHLTIFSRLNNPFVIGLIEAYWDAYEIVGLNVFSDYEYLERVWNYHQQMVDAILDDDYDAGYQALIEHVGLLHHRPGLNRVYRNKMKDVSDNRDLDDMRSDD